MERMSTGASLDEAVQDCASAVVSVLKGGHHGGVLEQAVGAVAPNPVWVGAVRVLGADVLVPQILAGRAPTSGDVHIVRAAVAEFVPGPQASAATLWTYWGLCEALRATGSGMPGAVAQPDTGWVRAMTWPELTHRLAQLAALAVPNPNRALFAEISGRMPDVARGFARAVRRRDWRQAAGAGRWLTLLGGFPPSLGLEAGLEFVEHMGSGDARVELHVQAARLIRRTGA